MLMYIKQRSDHHQIVGASSAAFTLECSIYAIMKGSNKQMNATAPLHQIQV